MASLIGTEIGKYRITERIGRGGMAEVYEGMHTHLDKKVAIKVLHSHLLEGGDFVARFKREAKAVANLQHPNIVQVYDFDIQDDVIFMVMQYIEGDSLHAKLVEAGKKGVRLPIKQIASIISAIAGALDYAHTKGMLHRDIKPSNIMIDNDGKAYLTDFGIAKLLDDPKFTATGQLVGTPAYMSPEQGQGEDLTEESDIYSLGVVAFEMLTGQVPYDAPTPIGIMLKQINDPVPSMSDLAEGVPSSAQEVIDRALSKSPGSRYTSAEELVAALRVALTALESQKPVEVSVPEDPPTVVDDGLDAPTVTMQAEELEGETVVMETGAKKLEPVKEKPAKKKPRGEKKKVPLWAYIMSGVALLVVVGIILIQTLGFNPAITPSPTATEPSIWEAPTSAPTAIITGEDLYLQAIDLCAAGQYQECIDQGFEALAAGHVTAAVYEMIGGAYFDLGDYESASVHLDMALEIDPNHVWAYFVRGDIKQETGDLEGALEDFHKGIEIDPDVFELYMNLVEVYYELGDLDEAIAALDQAYELNPDNLWVRTWKAHILWDEYHDQEGALENLEIAIANQYDDPSSFPYDIRGDIYHQTGQYELCISNYEESINLVPDHPWSYYNRGSCYRNIGEHDAARQDFERFLELTAGDPEYDDARSDIQESLDNLNN